LSLPIKTAGRKINSDPNIRPENATQYQLVNFNLAVNKEEEILKMMEEIYPPTAGFTTHVKEFRVTLFST
jgi:hypothetical protein